MPKNRIIITLGAIVALLPIFGFPRLWESIFQVFAGLSIISLSVWATINKKLAQKAKARERIGRREPDFDSTSANPPDLRA